MTLRLPWLRWFGLEVTRARATFVLTVCFVLVSSAPLAVAHIGPQHSPEQASEWVKIARELGVPGVMAVAFGYFIWKVTPKALGVLDLMHASLTEIKAFMKRVDDRLNADEVRQEKKTADLLQRALDDLDRRPD